MKGDGDLHGEAAGGAAMELEAVLRAVEVLQAGAGIPQPDAFAQRAAGGVREPDAIVGDAQVQRSVAPLCLDLDPAG
jgi:hypothetical protein